MSVPAHRRMTIEQFLEELLEDLYNRYDGAEDSGSRWMGYYIYRIQQLQTEYTYPNKGGNHV